MTWPSRFLAVPTARLRQDGSIPASPKPSAERVREYMSYVPAVYERMREGAGAAEFEAMRRSPDPQLHGVGETYHHLFSPSGIDHRLEAELVNGTDVTITRGHHRIEAAKQLDLPYLPVHVRAPDDQSMEAIARTYEAEVAASAPAVVDAQRRLDAEHRAVRVEPDRVPRATIRDSSRGQTRTEARSDRPNRERSR